MVFCEIDDKLIEIIHQIADGRRIVDLGAGECMFEYKYKQKYPHAGVISVELYPQDSYYIDRSDVTRMDARTFPMQPDDLPIFIRPCHSVQFVPEVLDEIEDIVPEALYISNPRNLLIDIPEKYTVENHWKWTGSDDGEKIYKIWLNGPKYVKKEDEEYYLAKLDPSWKDYVKMKKILRNGEFWLVNSKGGGMPMKYITDFKKFNNE